MTVGTNALLERSGARTALVATRGLHRRDRDRRARRARSSTGRARPPRTRSCPRAALRGSRADGTPRACSTPLERESLGAAVLGVRRAPGVEAVAVSLLHSYADTRPRAGVADARRTAPAGRARLRLARGLERLPRVRAKLDDRDRRLPVPLLAGYLERLGVAARSAGLPAPADHAVERRPDVREPLPAAMPHGRCFPARPAGAVGAAYLGGLAERRNVLSFDMGGTSCDVRVVDGGRVRQTGEREIGGRVLALPMVDVHTVGAGGGSIGWVDPAARCASGRIGRSAARAGLLRARRQGGDGHRRQPPARLSGRRHRRSPAASGSTSAPPSAPSPSWRPRRPRHVETRRRASSGWPTTRCCAPCGVVTVERGVDPRGYALVAFGGAGPMHAARDRRGARDRARPLPARCRRALRARARVLRPPARRRAQRPAQRGGADRAARSARSWTSSRRDGDGASCPRPGSRSVRPALPRARRSSSADRGDERRRLPPELRDSFDGAHAERYGYTDRDAELELVNVRVAAASPAPRADAAGAPARAAAAAARAARPRFDGERVETAVVTGELGAGNALEGPAVCELPEATVVVPPGWIGEVDARHVVLERAVSERLDPVTLQVLTGALRATCEEMGAVLVRAAHSANIKERRDASTALFDAARADGHAGGAHPGPSRRDAGGGRGRARARSTGRATPGSSTTRTRAGRTSRTSRSSRRSSSRASYSASPPPRPPRRRRRDARREHAGRLAHAGGGGRRDPPTRLAAAGGSTTRLLTDLSSRDAPAARSGAPTCAPSSRQTASAVSAGRGAGGAHGPGTLLGGHGRSPRLRRAAHARLRSERARRDPRGA